MSRVTESPPNDYGQRLRSRGRLGRGALLPALAISALLHVIALLGIRFPAHTPEDRPPPPLKPLVQVVEAMQAYDLAIVVGDVAPIEVQVREREEIVPVLPLPEVPSGAAEGAASEGNTAADPQPLKRLEYRRAEVDVWRPPPEVPLEVVAPEARVRERIAAQIKWINDSIAAEAARVARATDWTKTTEDGGRWGVSPGKIHLGDITLPLPLALSVPPGRRDEIAGRMRTWQEVNLQAARVEGDEIIQERLKAMRERAAEERRRRAAADSARSGN